MPSNFNPATEIPSLSGKRILITGANTGIGYQTALQLAAHDPREIWLTSRTLSRAQAAIDSIRAVVPKANLKPLELDLASLDSVKTAATEFLRQTERLDILICNAGIMSVPASLTQEGYEVQFGTNHLGHAALIKLLLPRLEATSAQGDADARIVLVSSMAHKHAPCAGIDFATLKTPAEAMATNDRYCQSKLANVLYARELAKRYPKLTSVSVHPGIVKTDLHALEAGNFVIRAFSKYVVPLIGVDVEQGAKNQLWAATAEGVESGEYYTPVGVKGGDSALSKDAALARKLWEWTEGELTAHGI